MSEKQKSAGLPEIAELALIISAMIIGAIITFFVAITMVVGEDLNEIKNHAASLR